MATFKKVCAVIYLMASIIALACLLGLMFGPFTGRFQLLIASNGGQALLGACVVIAFAGSLASACRVLVRRPEAAYIHPAGHEDIEVTTAALASVARTAASQLDVMVEDVSVRVDARDGSSARVRIDAIAFVNEGLDELAQRVQLAVRTACEHMLGAGDVAVRVRFLPSETIVVAKEER